MLVEPAVHGDPTEPYLVRVLSVRQTVVFGGLLGAWLLGVLTFWHWWLNAEHVVSLLGLLANSGLLVWTTSVPAWCFAFALRARQPNPAQPLPAGRVAMIVTKTPSEPWPLVRRTLEAMLAQQLTTPIEFWLGLAGRRADPPRTVDVWLADEDPSEETRAWCLRHGVRISCRRGVAGYHNPRWPARARSKEGNLRYFYEAMGGYDAYDFVVQLDADHVPEPSYLIEMLRPFADPRVGYVAAPSIGDANAHRSWTARARANAEAVLHGAWQAGYNGGASPLCFGSHYAVRTRALREVGGLGPELAEDHSTSLLLKAGGWRGAFAVNAIAHGDGPANVADALRQELQWSRSLGLLLLAWLPRVWRRLDLHARLVFCSTELWYPLLAVYMLASYLLPTLALVTRTPLVAVDVVDFALHAGLLGACTLAPVVWLRRQGLLRPADARVLSWETGLYQLVRWPWVLAGITQALLAWRLGRDFEWRITPKGSAAARTLPWSVFLTPLALGLGQVAVAVLVDAPGLARGYYAFLLQNAAMYLLVAGALEVLHLRDTAWHLGRRQAILAATLLRALPPLAVASLALVGAVQLRGGAVRQDLQPTLTLLTGVVHELGDPEEGDVVTRARVALGLAGLPWGWSASIPGAQTTSRELDLPVGRVAVGAYDPRLELQHAQLDVEHWFLSQDEPQRLAAALEHARNRRTLLVTIEPYPERDGPPVLEATATAAADSQIRRLARLIRDASPQRVLVRWGHEMDLTGFYPWASDDPELYRAAFRHVVEVFRAEGATNARFVWSPAGEPGAERFFPGADVVDYVGLTILGDATWDRAVGLPPQSFADLLAPRYARVAPLNKPVIVAELGVSGSPERQADWLADASRALDRFPAIRGLVYFDEQNPPVHELASLPDWHITPDALRTLIPGGVMSSAPEMGRGQPS